MIDVANERIQRKRESAASRTAGKKDDADEMEEDSEDEHDDSGHQLASTGDLMHHVR